MRTPPTVLCTLHTTRTPLLLIYFCALLICLVRVSNIAPGCRTFTPAPHFRRETVAHLYSMLCRLRLHAWRRGWYCVRMRGAVVRRGKPLLVAIVFCLRLWVRTTICCHHRAMFVTHDTRVAVCCGLSQL